MPGRPQKAGIDYAGWDVDIFDNDRSIDALLDAQGWVGFGIYFYLCQRAYGSFGYYFSWDYPDAPTIARKMGGGIRSDAVINTVNFCFRIGLFDKNLFDREKIITSRGIQRRYKVALENRRCKVVIKDYWLLDTEESKGLAFRTLKPNCDPANSNYDPANANYTPANSNYEPIKESKAKESKSTTADKPQEEEPVSNPKYQKILDEYNRICVSLPTAKRLSDKRKHAINARLSSGYTFEDFICLFEKAEKSRFLKGGNKRNWRADFDWLICDSNMAKALDGKYDDGRYGANGDTATTAGILSGTTSAPDNGTNSPRRRDTVVLG